MYVTGEAPPPSPVTPESYQENGIPWFDFYFAEGKTVRGSEKLRGLDSLAAASVKKGKFSKQLSKPVVITETIDLSTGRRVRDGKY